MEKEQLKQEIYENETHLDVDILSSQLTLDKASKLVLCSLNRGFRQDEGRRLAAPTS